MSQTRVLVLCRRRSLRPLDNSKGDIVPSLTRRHRMVDSSGVQTLVMLLLLELLQAFGNL